jgi:hypothetical protein
VPFLRWPSSEERLLRPYQDPPWVPHVADAYQAPGKGGLMVLNVATSARPLGAYVGQITACRNPANRYVFGENVTGKAICFSVKWIFFPDPVIESAIDLYFNGFPYFTFLLFFSPQTVENRRFFRFSTWLQVQSLN